MDRTARVARKTGETEVKVSLNLDGEGKADVSTPVAFLDHMLVLFSTHGLFDITVKAAGDVEVDNHHTVEDIGICLGQAFREALGERKGIARFGESFVPMDEALAQAVVDISGRPYLVFNVRLTVEKVGGLEAELAREFFQAFVIHCGLNLHLNLIHGVNNHHILEAVFKAWARALARAVVLDPRRGDEVPSSKGSLDS